MLLYTIILLYTILTAYSTHIIAMDVVKSSTSKIYEPPFPICSVCLFISSSHHLHYQNIQCFIMAMPLNIILILYVITCTFSCDFIKLTFLYTGIHVYISLQGTKLG